MKNFLKENGILILVAIVPLFYYFGSSNVFLLGKDSGMSQEFVGDVLIVNIMVNDSETTWTQDKINSYLKYTDEAADFMEESAGSYGTYLSIDTAYITYDTSDFSIPYCRDNEKIDEFYKKFLSSEGMESFKKLEEYHSKGQYDEVCYVFATLNEGRSYAFVAEGKGTEGHSEFACVFNSSYMTTTIAHEVLHLFGAADLYYSEDIQSMTQTYLGKSIMGEHVMRIDGLTAYLVGWKNELTAEEEGFLKATNHYSKAEYYDLRLNAEIVDVLNPTGLIKIKKDEVLGMPSELIYFKED